MNATRLTALAALFLIFCTMPLKGRDYEYYTKNFSIHAEDIDIRLDIDAAEVEVKSGERAELSVEAEFSRGLFEMRTEFDEKRSRLKIEFKKNSWTDSDDNSHARVVVKLPQKTEIALRAKIRAGEIEMDFGELAVDALDLNTWAGEVDVDFSKPNRIEMSDLHINTKIGETRIRHLGNSRFRDAEIDGGIGEMNIDFSGKMADNARVDIDLDIGKTNLDLPEQLGVRLAVSEFLFLSETSIPDRFVKSGRYYFSRGYDKAECSIELHVNHGIGSLVFK